jgi:hypothetical protein
MTPKNRETYFSKHLRYEVWMLGETYKRLDWSDRPIPDVEENALIESFCVHARVLIEFLMDSDGADFYTTVEYDHKTKKYEKLKGRLNQQITLLFDGRTDETFEQITGPERTRLLDLLRPDIATFKRNLKPEYDPKELGELPVSRPYTLRFNGSGRTTTGPSRTLTSGLGPVRPPG